MQAGIEERETKKLGKHLIQGFKKQGSFKPIWKQIDRGRYWIDESVCKRISTTGLLDVKIKKVIKKKND